MTDLVTELRRWGSLKVGDIPPAPDNQWGPPLTKLLNDSADRLERLEKLLERVLNDDQKARMEACDLLWADEEVPT